MWTQIKVDLHVQELNVFWFLSTILQCAIKTYICKLLLKSKTMDKVSIQMLCNLSAGSALSNSRLCCSLCSDLWMYTEKHFMIGRLRRHVFLRIYIRKRKYMISTEGHVDKLVRIGALKKEWTILIDRVWETIYLSTRSVYTPI